MLKNNGQSRLKDLIEENNALKSKILMLEADNERLQHAVNIASDGIWDWNIEEDALYLTPQWFESLHYDNEEIPSTIEEWKKLVHPDDLERTWEQLQHHIYQENDIYECENRLKLRTGEYRWNLDRGKVVQRNQNGQAIRMIGIDKDITKEKVSEQKNKELARELQQAKKLEAMGMFAGGIAHEFNNILSIAFGLTGLIEITSEQDSQHQEYVNKLNTLLSRAKDLVVQILTFSRDNEGNAEFIHIKTAIAESMSVLENFIEFSSQMMLNSQCDDLYLLIDKTHFYQLITNLCINADQAITESSGIISMSIEEVDINLEKLQPLALSDVKSALCISVRDNGKGIQKENLSKVFEPFYSTKKHGTGMGLSIVYSLVKRYNGIIDVQSVLGEGSVFNIYFPLNSENSMNCKCAPEERNTCEDSVRGSSFDEQYKNITYKGKPKILFVDDEEMILEVFKGSLAVFGMEVDTFSCAKEALAHFEKKKDYYDLLITDQSMPSLTGLELIQKIRQLKANFPVILCTGYNDFAAKITPQLNINGLVLKPIQITEMMSLIDEVMNNKVDP